MANQSEPNREEITRENRYMWIAVGVIVIILFGGMGIDMLIHRDGGTSTTEISTSAK